MVFDSKIAIVVSEDLATWQKLDVACFLSGGLVGLYPELGGRCYVDASGQTYGPLVRQPILVFAASAEDLTRTLRRHRSDPQTHVAASRMMASIGLVILGSGTSSKTDIPGSVKYCSSHR
jgi:hypothetical protein